MSAWRPLTSLDCLACGKARKFSLNFLLGEISIVEEVTALTVIFLCVTQPVCQSQS